MRPVKPNGGAFFEIAEPVGQESLFYAVEAEIEGSWSAGSRRDGIGAGVGFPVGFRLLDGDELPGSKSETVCSLDSKFQVLRLVGKEDRPR